MFTYKDKDYELKFNIGRLKLVEKATGESAVGMMNITNNGLMSLTAVEGFFRYGLKEAGADSFVPPNTAADICDAMIEEAGYPAVVQMIQNQLMNDMPFLFRVA